MPLTGWLRVSGASAAGEPEPFDRGLIHYILTNPVCADRIRHRDQIHEGQQPATIEPAVWDSVQAMPSEGAVQRRGDGKSRLNGTSPSSGKLFDETGNRLTPSRANKQGRRYRYYADGPVDW